MVSDPGRRRHGGPDGR